MLADAAPAYKYLGLQQGLALARLALHVVHGVIVLDTHINLDEGQAVRVEPLAQTPLNDLGTGSYLNQYQGGLYPNGSNAVPAVHSGVGRSRALNLGPLNTAGQPDPNGKYVLLSIGMSNTTQEFCSPNSDLPATSWSFMGQAAVNPVVIDAAVDATARNEAGPAAVAATAIDEVAGAGEAAAAPPAAPRPRRSRFANGTQAPLPGDELPVTLEAAPPLDAVAPAPPAAGPQGLHGPVIVECVVDEHGPPYPAKVKKDQVSKLVSALREGTPNRRRIALQMVRDMLDESSFDASPAHSVPGPVGKAAAKIAGKLRETDS